MVWLYFTLSLWELSTHFLFHFVVWHYFWDSANVSGSCAMLYLLARFLWNIQATMSLHCRCSLRRYFCRDLWSHCLSLQMTHCWTGDSDGSSIDMYAVSSVSVVYCTFTSMLWHCYLAERKAISPVNNYIPKGSVAEQKELEMTYGAA